LKALRRKFHCSIESHINENDFRIILGRFSYIFRFSGGGFWGFGGFPGGSIEGLRGPGGFSGGSIGGLSGPGGLPGGVWILSPFW
jgi:hypothetical protein